MYTALIVDDNKVIRLMLVEMLKKIDGITVAGECDTAISARTFLKNEKIDILFLDIEMPGMTGLELLKVLPERPATILVTAKPGYAIEAFELNVIDYLVKPFSIARVIQAVEKAIELLKMKNVHVNKIEQDHLFIRDNKIIRKILLNDILWLESKGDYVKITTGNMQYVIHSTLKSLGDKLPENDFVRIHRGYIVPISKIDYIEDSVVFIRDTPLPVSETYRNELLKKLRLI
jgi:DNA-binding LytR/AlgR family response regulator